MKNLQHPMRDEAAYITIVEGPPPEFMEVDTDWTASIAEGPFPATVAKCETRTLNGKALVERCHQAWHEGRPARLDFPQSDGERDELEIVGACWEQVSEGQKLILWVKVEDFEVVEEDDLEY